MRSCMFFSTVDALFGRSTFIIVCLSVRPLSESVVKVAPPPINFTPAFLLGWHLPIIVLFYRFYLSTLGFQQKLEESTPFLRVLLIFLVSPAFWEGVPKWSVLNPLHFPFLCTDEVTLSSEKFARIY